MIPGVIHAYTNEVPDPLLILWTPLCTVGEWNSCLESIIEIKKVAKQGQMGAAKIMAKDLVRTRNHVQRFFMMRAQLHAISLRIQTLQSTQTMAEAIRGVTRAMVMMNRQMNLPAMQKIMMEFERQSEKMDMVEEFMDDAIDGAMENEGDEELSDEIVNQVLDEIGINVAQSLVDIPSTRVKVAAEKEPEPLDDELQARLDNLKK